MCILFLNYSVIRKLYLHRHNKIDTLIYIFKRIYTLYTS